MNFAIVVSEFNEKINSGLLEGAREELKDHDTELFHAPGAFEAPIIAQTLAKTKKYDGIVCLGSVIKGDTAHFEFISLGATVGLQQASLQTGVPMAFGILTVYERAQAEVRSAQDAHNKGREAALACLKTASLLSKINS